MRKLSLLLLTLLSGLVMVAQTPKTDSESNEFTIIKQLPITSIKDQANSGTCWSYSTTGFLESEILRKGGPEVDLSDMFVVNHTYRDKAEKYVRLHGKGNLAQGGSFYDVLYVFDNYGAVPEELMTGLNYGTKKNAHSELEAVLKGMLDAVVENHNGRLSTAWKGAFNKVVDTYLGELPKEFTYKGKRYTPKSFAESLGIKASDYVSLTSYTHHPFYTAFPIEIEDNWRWSSSWNLPIDELMQVIDNAIEKGYPIAWGADVSEVGFTRDGIGVLADVEAIETKGSDQARWVGLSYSDKAAEIRRMINRADCPEIEPTQEFRQEGFDNYTLTDDHGMVMIGKAKNQLGRPFYMIKNSWGESGKYNGIWYVSKNYVAGRTMNIVVHRDAIPAAIAKKLGLK